MIGSIIEAEANVRQVARIILIDRGAVIPASVAGIVADALSPRTSGACKSQGGLRFLRRSRKGRVLVPRGLLPRVMTAIAQSGYQIELIDRRVFAQFPRVESHGWQPPSSTLLMAIVTAVSAVVSAGIIGGGAIAIHSRTMLPDVIATIASLFPSETILVVVINESAANNMAQRLRALVTLPVTANTGYQYQDGPQLHVDNMHSMIGRNVDDWGVVIVADLESARSMTVIDQVRYMDKSCVFAIVPADSKLDTEDRLRLEMLCGPEIYRQPGDASALTSVEIAWHTGGPYPTVQPKDALERKRLCFWGNCRRNLFLADVAKAVRTLDLASLRQYGLHDTHVVQEALQRSQPPSVCVLVETPEHARFLGKHLPGWKLIRSRNAEQGDPTLPLMLDQAVVTIPGAYEQGLAFDVVIRAAGTEQTWKPVYGPHAGISGSDMLIIDVLDDIDERAQLDCARREGDYQRRGWLCKRASRPSVAGNETVSSHKVDRHPRGG